MLVAIDVWLRCETRPNSLPLISLLRNSHLLLGGWEFFCCFINYLLHQAKYFSKIMITFVPWNDKTTNKIQEWNEYSLQRRRYGWAYTSSWCVSVDLLAHTIFIIWSSGKPSIGMPMPWRVRSLPRGHWALGWLISWCCFSITERLPSSTVSWCGWWLMAWAAFPIIDCLTLASFPPWLCCWCRWLICSAPCRIASRLLWLWVCWQLPFGLKTIPSSGGCYRQFGSISLDIWHTGLLSSWVRGYPECLSPLDSLPRHRAHQGAASLSACGLDG